MVQHQVFILFYLCHFTNVSLCGTIKIENEGGNKFLGPREKGLPQQSKGLSQQVPFPKKRVRLKVICEELAARGGVDDGLTESQRRKESPQDCRFQFSTERSTQQKLRVLSFCFLE